jgi:outer membrane protein OmpA-like peptidoglycan-associated protein
MSRFARIAVFCSISVLVAPSVLPAQSMADRLKRRAEEAKRKVEDATLDKAENAVKCAVTDTACQERAKAEGKKVVVDSSAQAAPGAANAAATSGSSALKPGEGAWVNYDFVPGTRPLFVDDFTKDNVGDFPRRLEFLEGNMEVAEWKGARYLRVTSWPGRFAITLPEQLPERFTIEFDATPGYNSNWIIFKFADQAADDVRFRLYGGKGQGGVFGATHQSQGQTTQPIGDGEIFRARIMADGRYVKVYMNDTRVANIPNAELGRSNKITVEIPGKEDAAVFLTNLSVMAGGKKLYDAIAAEGRVATQGIYFDTGSDRIRPESTPTLKEIAAMLSEHADLKLMIEGHTDNVGQAAANQALSEKRAEAVRQTLVTSFGVDASRLAAKGLGATKPAASNETPEGRQQNRRVELVKN